MLTEPEPARRLTDREIDAICLDFESGWQSGCPTALDALVRAAPESARPTLFRHLLALEAEYRNRTGTPLTPDEARARFCALGGWVAEVIDGLPVPAVVLEALTGPSAGKSFTLAGQSAFMVGRGAGRDICLPADKQVSRVHCLFKVKWPIVRVFDLQSRHGTWVNDVQVDRADLRDRDRVRVGGTVLRVRIMSAGSSGGPHRPAAPAGSERAAGFPAVPHYRVVEELGRGSRGVVYRGVRLADGLTVAVKTLWPAVPPTDQALGRLKREALILARLDHPHVVKFLEGGAACPILYFVMEYVSGRNGAEVVAASGPLAPERALGWAAQMIDGLDHAHERGFVHRDVKPSNLLVSGEPGSERVKVSDFGLARALAATGSGDLSRTDLVGGTLDFMAPERVRDFRTVKPAADQYALAATLFYLLTGLPVYGRPGLGPEGLDRLLNEDPLPLHANAPALPPPFGPVIRRALARNPDARYPDLKAMKADLFTP